jgi:hypothetical protein
MSRSRLRSIGCHRGGEHEEAGSEPQSIRHEHRPPRRILVAGAKKIVRKIA